nr:hypothetical protein [Acetatifactor sp.]
MKRWIWKNGMENRIMAIVMSFMMLFSIADIDVYAASENENAEGGTIVAFESLAEDVMFQTISVGESLEDISFPTQLQATVEVVTEVEVIPEEEAIEEAAEEEATEEVVEEEATEEAAEEEAIEEAAEEEATEEAAEEEATEEA